MEDFTVTSLPELFCLPARQQNIGPDALTKIEPLLSEYRQGQNLNGAVEKYIIGELIKANLYLRQKNIEKIREIEQLRRSKEEDQAMLVNNIRSEMGVPEISKNKSKVISDFKILCIGDSKLNTRQVHKIFNEACQKYLGTPFLKKHLNACVLDYSKAKNFDIRKAIKHNRYDLMVLGPHPHSMKNKKISENLNDLKQHYNLKGNVVEKCSKPLSREFLVKTAENFFSTLI